MNVITPSSYFVREEKKETRSFFGFIISVPWMEKREGEPGSKKKC